jgi:hypothetical protein
VFYLTQLAIFSNNTQLFKYTLQITFLFFPVFWSSFIHFNFFDPRLNDANQRDLKDVLWEGHSSSAKVLFHWCFNRSKSSCDKRLLHFLFFFTTLLHQCHLSFPALLCVSPHLVFPPFPWSFIHRIIFYAIEAISRPYHRILKLPTFLIVFYLQIFPMSWFLILPLPFVS